MSDQRDHGPWPEFDADAFAGRVLGQTSGSACERAAAQMGDLMADRLTGLDRQLVQAHLEHCTGCRELAITEGWLTALLPQMAELDPGPEFLAGVLRQTTAARRAVATSADPAGVAGWMDRLGRWWERRIVRPQFAVQVAYVATVLLVLVTYTPGSPFRKVPHQALTVMTAGPQTAPLIGPAMARASSWVDNQGAAAVDAGRGQVAGGWHRLDESLAQRTARTSVSRGDLATHWQGFIAQASAREMGGAGYELLAVLASGRTVWQQWWDQSKMTSGR